MSLYYSLYSSRCRHHLHLLRQRNDRIHLGHSHGSGTSARESLNSKNLVVEVLVGEAVLGPGVEVVGSGDGTRSTLALPDGPVLGESGSASDGRLVGASVGAEGVGRAVRGDAAELSNTRRDRAFGKLVNVE